MLYKLYLGFVFMTLRSWYSAIFLNIDFKSDSQSYFYSWEESNFNHKNNNIWHSSYMIHYRVQTTDFHVPPIFLFLRKHAALSILGTVWILVFLKWNVVTICCNGWGKDISKRYYKNKRQFEIKIRISQNMI